MDKTNNTKSRESLLKHLDEADWHYLQNEPRLATDAVQARGIGVRRLQLVYLPSWVDPAAFEVRQLDNEWRLFSSRVVETWPLVRLLGYDQVPLDSAALAMLFARVTAVSMPIGPDLTGSHGYDGDKYHLTIFGDLFSECRFQWWSDFPPQWQPLMETTREMLKAFAQARATDSSR